MKRAVVDVQCGVKLLMGCAVGVMDRCTPLLMAAGDDEMVKADA